MNDNGINFAQCHFLCTKGGTKICKCTRLEDPFPEAFISIINQPSNSNGRNTKDCDENAGNMQKDEKCYREDLEKTEDDE